METTIMGYIGYRIWGTWGGFGLHEAKVENCEDGLGKRSPHKTVD